MALPPIEYNLYKFCPHCGKDLLPKTIDHEEVKICSSCDYIFWNKPKPVVSIVIHKDGKVLMIQRANEPFKGYWVLPGGFIGYDEIAEEAIKREAEEEVGNKVMLEQIIGTYKIDTDPRGRHLDIIFSGTIHNDVKLNKDNDHWRYYDPNHLPENITYKHREAIMDWSNKHG